MDPGTNSATVPMVGTLGQARASVVHRRILEIGHWKRGKIYAEPQIPN